MYPYHMDRFGYFGGALVVGLLIALAVALIVWFVVWVTGRGTGSSSPSVRPRTSSALSILEERYAKGEIDRDDYLQRKADLTHD
jgi:putative membrane protein